MKQHTPIWPLLVLLVVTGCGGGLGRLSTDETARDRDRQDGQREQSVASAETTSETPSADGRYGRTRAFRFHYRFTVSGLKWGKTVRIWLPVPTSSSEQRVELLPYTLPAEPSFRTEPKYNNRILYVETPAPKSGQLTIDVPYRIRRREVLARKPIDNAANPRKLSQRERRLFLQANAKVPVQGKPLALLSGIALANDVSELARQLYDRVDQHVTYKKAGTGWGHGDVLWVCDSRYGNCTDFHSLFISLARSQGLPARFEIGFSIPTDAEQGTVGGYHCWAWFYTEMRGWVPVDISEADKHPSLSDYYFGNLTADRVTFSVGRDILLEPQQQGERLNFFIYPHVEVDGAPLPCNQIALQFAYANLAK